LFGMMNTSVSKASAPHYKWGGSCEGWRLADTAALSVIEERVPPGGEEVRHFHRIARQFFYVLEGEATLEVEGVMHKVVGGSGIEIAPGQRHKFLNKSERDVCFLVISTPSTKGDREEVK